VPVGRWSQDLVRITKDEQGIHEQKLIGVRFVPMVGEAEKHR
jgi:protein-L-isoaspartate O-methyltransferase